MEIGGTKCLVLQQDSSLGQIATVVLRGSTDQARLALSLLRGLGGFETAGLKSCACAAVHPSCTTTHAR